MYNTITVHHFLLILYHYKTIVVVLDHDCLVSTRNAPPGVKNNEGRFLL